MANWKVRYRTGFEPFRELQESLRPSRPKIPKSLKKVSRGGLFQDFFQPFWDAGAGGHGRLFFRLFGISGQRARETPAARGRVRRREVPPKCVRGRLGALAQGFSIFDCRNKAFWYVSKPVWIRIGYVSIRAWVVFGSGSRGVPPSAVPPYDFSSLVMAGSFLIFLSLFFCRGRLRSAIVKPRMWGSAQLRVHTLWHKIVLMEQIWY